MRQIVVDPPAPATERANRWADVEDAIAGLQELGWRLEKLTQTDEAGEPLRVYVRLAYEPSSSLPGVL